MFLTDFQCQGFLPFFSLLVVLIFFRLAINTLNCFEQLFLPSLELLGRCHRFPFYYGLDLELARCGCVLYPFDLALERLNLRVELSDLVLAITLLKCGVAISQPLLINVLGFVVL